MAAGLFNEHTVHVLGEPIVIPEEHRVTVALSTINLLLNLYRQSDFGVPRFVCVDTTHRLVKEGHCCLLVGTMASRSTSTSSGMASALTKTLALTSTSSAAFAMLSTPRSRVTTCEASAFESLAVREVRCDCVEGRSCRLNKKEIAQDKKGN